MTDGLRIEGKDSSKVRGVSASVMYGLPPADQDRVMLLVSEGLTIGDALEVIAFMVVDRTSGFIREGRAEPIENPFRSS